jgi:formylglycine-generating enzyme required for sulfatase activity
MNNATDRERQIGELEAALHLPLPEAARRQIEISLQNLRAEGANLALANTVGRDLNQGAFALSGDARIDGVAVGVNLGTIIFGRTPEEEERRQLVWYLARLAARLRSLSLRGLDPQLDEGGDGLTLARVYVSLAVTRAALIHRVDSPVDEESYLPHMRAASAVEVVGEHQHMVLLGDPGSGKSTFLRHLAWTLAQWGIDSPHSLTPAPAIASEGIVPILVPLRWLAGRLALVDEQAYGGVRISKAARRHTETGTPDAVVYQALRDEMVSYVGQPVDDLLTEALHRGAALLLFDGLDEVPQEPVKGKTVSRLATLRAVREFAHLYERTRVVVTCRTRAFDQRLSDYLRWPVETIAPFTSEQIQRFADAWYGELAALGQLSNTQAARLAQELIDAIRKSPKLGLMAETPLLLTMMALVLYHDGALPRDRAQVYERILDLLLGQWDKLRDGQNVSEAIGHPDWDSSRIRTVLDGLSYAAHDRAVSDDGRGRLDRGDVRDALITFFEQARLQEPWSAARRCLEYFEQRSGLLIPDDDKTYMFAHLTLQEHCAGRYLMLLPDAVERVMAHRRRDLDRWYEPILLGLGVMQQTNPLLLDRMLTELIDREERGRVKPPVVRQSDLILAAEIGEDRDWDFMRTQWINVDRLQRDLRRGLVDLLRDRNQPLPADERVRAGKLLGRLGDPRFPVIVEEWRREVAWALNDGKGMDRRHRPYFCRVESGVYVIGSSDDPDASLEEFPQHKVTFDTPFWIGRFPITNEQWREWVRCGGKRAYFADTPGADLPNLPVVGVTWQMCNAFCQWLSEQIGVTIRLPSEYEWEAAARGRSARRYPWGDEWEDDRAAVDESLQAPVKTTTVPVGCYPAGAAPCGALDMAGNVGEWMADVWHSYPGAQTPFTDLRSGVVRGGGILSEAIGVRCAARSRAFFHTAETIGLRVILAPDVGG